MQKYDDSPIFSQGEEIHVLNFGVFTCEERIGRAIFKCVRKGDGASGKAYAFKAMHQEFSSNPEKMAQLAKECAVIARILHPNICEIHGVFWTTPTGSTPSVPVVVMQYLRGVSVRACMSRELRPVFQVQIAVQLLKGLGALHRAGIVHRDVRPENALLNDPGNGSRAVVLNDYDIVHVLGEPFPVGKIEGSPGYMSPAQWRGEVPTSADDIYATSVFLYEMCGGTRLFPNVNYEDPNALYNAHLNVTPVALKTLIASLPLDAVHPVSPAVIEMIERGLSKDPSKRPANTEEYLVPFVETDRRLRRGRAVFSRLRCPLFSL